MNDQYRVRDKENVFKNGHRTSYALYELQFDEFDRPFYARRASGFAPGWDASDEQCVEHYLESDDE